MIDSYKKRFLINFLYTVSLIITAIIVFKVVLDEFLPLVIAFLVAFSVQKSAALISHKTKIKKSICAGFLSAAVYVVTGALLGLLIYILSHSAKSFLGDFNSKLDLLSSVFSQLKNSVSNFLRQISPEIAVSVTSVLETLSENLIEKLSGFLSAFLETIVKNVPHFLFSSIVSLVLACYIAKDFDILKNFFKNLFGKKIYENTVKVKNILWNSVFKIIKGYLILSFITFIELNIALFLLGVKYSFILSLLIAFVDLLPVFGTGVVLIPWGIVEIMSGNSRGFMLIIIYLIITVVRNFAEPKIIGKQMGINPLFTLISMFIGLRFFGFWGLISFPLILITIIKFYKK